jgi:23S rRNA-/tRNA-specific pseudouridylate synthase
MQIQKYLGKGVRIIKIEPNLSLIALYKPSGVVSHRDVGGKAVSCLIESPYVYNKEYFQTPEGKIYLGHRLDKATSGVILVSTDAMVHKAMRESFKNRHVTKLYKAISFCSKEHARNCDKNHSKNQQWLFDTYTPKSKVFGKSKTTKPIVTPIIGTPSPMLKKERKLKRESHLYNVSQLLERLNSGNSSSEGNTYTNTNNSITSLNGNKEAQALIIESNLLDVPLSTLDNVNQFVPALELSLAPMTGFFHQLRLQLSNKTRNLPIIGDEIYGNYQKNKLFSKKRMYLHANAIEIKLELDGQTHLFFASTTEYDDEINIGAPVGNQGWNVAVKQLLNP